MVTWGFVCKYSDAVTVGSPFKINGITFTSYYIYVSGSSGDIVWQNDLGEANYIENAQAGQFYPIGASMILSSATVNGVTRTTSATNLVWLASPSAA